MRNKEKILGRGNDMLLRLTEYTCQCNFNLKYENGFIQILGAFYQEKDLGRKGLKERDMSFGFIKIHDIFR